MPKGENLTPEHQEAAARKHGVYPLKNNPLALWDGASRKLVEKLADELEDPLKARRRAHEHAAMGEVMLMLIMAYATEQNASGIPLDEIPILLKWGEFYRAYGKALKFSVELGENVIPGEGLIDLEKFE
jgi:hypothetical protein